jgi:hypothetical protein
MELNVSNVSSSKATVQWKHKNYTITYNYSLDATLSGPYVLVQPLIVAIDYERLADRIVGLYPEKVSRRHRTQLLNHLRSSFPSTFTVGS